MTEMLRSGSVMTRAAMGRAHTTAFGLSCFAFVAALATRFASEPPGFRSIAPRASLAWTWTRFGSCLSTAVGRSNRCGCSSGRFDHSEASLRGWGFDCLFLPSRPPGTWLRCSAGGVLLGLGLRVAAAPPMPRQDLVWLGDVLKHRKSATLPVELQGPEGARHATLRFNSIGICD